MQLSDAIGIGAHLTLMAMTRSNSSIALAANMDPNQLTPALLISTSTFPSNANKNSDPAASLPLSAPHRQKGNTKGINDRLHHALNLIFFADICLDEQHAAVQLLFDEGFILTPCFVP